MKVCLSPFPQCVELVKYEVRVGLDGGYRARELLHSSSIDALYPRETFAGTEDIVEYRYQIVIFVRVGGCNGPDDGRCRR